MNKNQKEMLDKCIKVSILDEVPLFDWVYMLPTNKKHDSGYKIMYIIGCVYDKENDEEKLYLLDTYCDVLQFGDFIKKQNSVHVDIFENGIIRFFSFDYKFKSLYRVSSCSFDLVKEINNG